MADSISKQEDAFQRGVVAHDDVAAGDQLEGPEVAHPVLVGLGVEHDVVHGGCSAAELAELSVGENVPA